MGRKKEDAIILALKIEIAAELGLLDKVDRVGWGALTSAESGKIGGLVAQKLRNSALYTAGTGKKTEQTGEQGAGQ